MRKILIIVPSLSKANGIASIFMNNYDVLKENFEVDFFLLDNKNNDSKYITKVSNNGNIYYAPKHNKFNKIKIIKKALVNIIDERKYDIVHINLVNIYALACILATIKCKTKNVIYHGHNPLDKGNISYLSNLINTFCIKHATKCIACTSAVGESLFKNKEYKIIHNAIMSDDYLFDLNYRENFREKNGFQNNYLIGVIGRLEDQKNPFFTLDIFYELKKMKPTAKLIFIGDGSLEEKLKRINEKSIYKDDVVFLGSRNDVNKIYSALDLLLIPSKYEGLGIVFIEAQVSNLTIVTSNKVPEDIKIMDNVHLLSLKNDKKYWANYINNLEQNHRSNNKKQISDKMYDIETNKNELVDLYKDLLEN